MLVTFYDLIRKKRQLNFTQKESMANVFCYRGHEVLRVRFMFALDKLIKIGTRKDLELYRRPFDDIVFASDNTCRYKPTIDNKDTQFPEPTLLESIRILITSEVDNR